MKFEIAHRPLFDVEKIIQHYTEKDNVDITYVCTSDLRADDVPCDIFYRSTPHPEFGNRYFGLYHDNRRDHLMITNADLIEDLDFGMLYHDGKYHYSQSRHDYHTVGDRAIDGGRAYVRIVGNDGVAYMFKVKDGVFELQRYPSEDSGVEGQI